MSLRHTRHIRRHDVATATPRRFRRTLHYYAIDIYRRGEPAAMTLAIS